MENYREMDLFQGDIDPEEVAARYLLLRALAFQASGRSGLGAIPELHHTHAFQWQIGPGVTVIDGRDEAWLREIGVLLDCLACEDRIPIAIDPAPEEMRELVEGGQSLPLVTLPEVTARRRKAMCEARVLAPLASPERRTASPIVLLTPDTEGVDRHPSMAAWLSTQSHLIQKLKDLGARVVILCSDRSMTDGLPLPAVDRHLIIGDLRLNGWIFRKVLQTFLGDLAQHDKLYQQPMMVGPGWIREHVTHLLMAQPRM